MAKKVTVDNEVTIKRFRGRIKRIKTIHMGVIEGIALDMNKLVCAIDEVIIDLNHNIGES